MTKVEMRIIQLVDTLDPGGAERMAVNLANEFTRRDISHRLIASRRFGVLSDLVENREEVLRTLHKKNTFDLRAFFRLTQIIKDFKPTTIHAHGTSVYWAWALKKRFPKLLLVWHDHLGISQDVIENNPRKEMKWIGKSLDWIITANQETQVYWQKQAIIPKERIEYLPNFPSINLPPRKLHSVFTFLHLANYRSEKGQISVIEAAKILHEKGINFRIRMVGREVDSSWKTQVRELVETYNLQQKISLEPEVGNVGELLSEVHAGLVASDREGLPVALLEYGLAGLPVVSTKVGQCQVVLGFGEFGVLVDSKSPASLAEGMEYLLKSPEKANQLGLSFQSQIEKNYGSSGFLKKYFQLISTSEN